MRKGLGSGGLWGTQQSFIRGVGGGVHPERGPTPYPFIYHFCQKSRARKNLNSSLSFGHAALTFRLPRATFLLVSVKDFIGPLLIGQVSFKSYLPSKKIHLSRITGREFFRALQKLPLLYTLYSQMVLLSHLD